MKITCTMTGMMNRAMTEVQACRLSKGQTFSHRDIIILSVKEEANLRGLSVRTEISDNQQVVCWSREAVDFYVHARQSFFDINYLMTNHEPSEEIRLIPKIAAPLKPGAPKKATRQKGVLEGMKRKRTVKKRVGEIMPLREECHVGTRMGMLVVYEIVYVLQCKLYISELLT